MAKNYFFYGGIFPIVSTDVIHITFAKHNERHSCHLTDVSTNLTLAIEGESSRVGS